MAGKEYDPTNKEGRSREDRKELPSESHEASQPKTPSEDTRGDPFMANPALEEHVTEEEKASQESPSQKQVEAKPKSLYLEALAENRIYRATTLAALSENARLNSENEQLLAENKELAEKVENRRRQARESAARKREANREAYNTYQSKLKKKLRDQAKQETESSKDKTSKDD